MPLPSPLSMELRPLSPNPTCMALVWPTLFLAWNFNCNGLPIILSSLLPCMMPPEVTFKSRCDHVTPLLKILPQSLLTQRINSWPGQTRPWSPDPDLPFPSHILPLPPEALGPVCPCAAWPTRLAHLSECRCSTVPSSAAPSLNFPGHSHFLSPVTNKPPISASIFSCQPVRAAGVAVSLDSPLWKERRRIDSRLGAPG